MKSAPTPKAPSRDIVVPEIRGALRAGIFAVNLIDGPGCGKTTPIDRAIVISNKEWTLLTPRRARTPSNLRRKKSRCRPCDVGRRVFPWATFENFRESK